MSRRRLKKRGSSKAGRPKKAGSRFPSGKLRQISDPNEKVVDMRRGLLGDLKVDLSVAEDAMRLALAHGWIDEAQHRAGEAYARAYTLSHPPQRSGVAGISESPDMGDRDMRTIGQMGSAEIVQAFDRILSSTPSPGASETRQVAARRRYVEMSQVMAPAEQSEVFLCFCARSWPQWINQRAAGRMDTQWERKRVLLVAGLSALAAFLKRNSRRAASAQDMVA